MPQATSSRPSRYSLTFCLTYSANLTWLVWLCLSMATQTFSFFSCFLLGLLIYFGLFHSRLTPFLQRYFIASPGFYRLLLSAWFLNGLCLLSVASKSMFASEGAMGQGLIILAMMAISHVLLLAAVIAPLLHLIRLPRPE